MTALVVPLRSMSRPYWRSPVQCSQSWRLGDDALLPSYNPADVLPSCFSDWGRRVFCSTSGQPSAAVALMAHSSRSFDRWLFSHWCFFAVLSAGSSYSWVPYRWFPHWCNGKSLERGGSYTGELVLCSGLVDDCRTHRRYMEPHHGRTLVTDNHINTTHTTN